MKRYQITGMSCAACSARVEKAVSKVEGVTSCSVSLLTNSLVVEGSHNSDLVVAAVVNAGYGASLEKTKNVEKTDINSLKYRLFSSLVFLIILMYLSMGHTMWGWPLPAFLSQSPLLIGLSQMILTIIIMIINRNFFISGFKSLFHRSPNMDTLVALGACAGFVYSSVFLYIIMITQISGNIHHAFHYLHELYFESSAMILTLITLGKLLESRAKGRTTNALNELIKLAPQTACVIRNENEQIIPINQLIKDDIFIVRPGESIPADGIILEGESSVNESALTGESIPVYKSAGNNVSAATISQSGFLKCKAINVGEDTLLSQIIKMVSDTAASKAPIAKIADKVSGIFVPCVMIIALITAIVWLIFGQTIGFSLARAISVLVISCPCALGLATPVAIMVASGKGAKKGILFKTATSLEIAGKTNIVVLDKTGTITCGQPKVTDIIPQNSRDNLLEIAFALEQKSEHPLSKAIVDYCKDNSVSLTDITDFQAVPGSGISGKLNNHNIYGGNFDYVSKFTNISDNILTQAQILSNSGKTPLFFCEDERFLGIIAVADVIKQDSPQAISQLKNMDISVIMLTGDNELTANHIGKQAGVDRIIAGVLPNQKEAVIKKLQKDGKVAMVGDGINDAPALTRADIGIAIGAGTDVAIDAADIVLMKSSLSDVPAAIKLSMATIKNIKQNLFWAFIYNIIGIPLAAGVWIPIFNLQLNPMFGALAMSLSSFCVVSNALRLNLIDIYQNYKKDGEIMTKVMKIQGIMCGHCEATVKKALESIPGVISAQVSHQDGSAIVSLSQNIENDILKKAVEDKDYTVIEII